MFSFNFFSWWLGLIRNDNCLEWVDNGTMGKSWFVNPWWYFHSSSRLEVYLIEKDCFGIESNWVWDKCCWSPLWPWITTKVSLAYKYISRCSLHIFYLHSFQNEIRISVWWTEEGNLRILGFYWNWTFTRELIKCNPLVLFFMNKQIYYLNFF